MEKEAEPTTDDWDFPADEMVGRFIDTPLGAQEKVVMKRVFWAYYDWLTDQGLNTKALIRHCYKRHPELSLSASLHWLLAHIAYYRQQNDIENPRWLIAAPLPSGYEEF